MCCRVPVQNSLLGATATLGAASGVAALSIPRCPPQQLFAVGSSRAAADVPVPLLHVPSQPSLSISAINKKNPWACLHSLLLPPRPSVPQPPNCDMPEEIGQKEANYKSVFPFAHSSAGRRAGGWHTKLGARAAVPTVFARCLASRCIRRGSDWTLGKISLLKEWSGIGPGCQGGGGVPIPGGVQKTCRRGTSGHGLAGMVVLG